MAMVVVLRVVVRVSQWRVVVSVAVRLGPLVTLVHVLVVHIVAMRVLVVHRHISRGVTAPTVEPSDEPHQRKQYSRSQIKESCESHRRGIPEQDLREWRAEPKEHCCTERLHVAKQAAQAHLAEVSKVGFDSGEQTGLFGRARQWVGAQRG